MNNFTYNSFTELFYLSYLDCHRIKVLFARTFSVFGISDMNMFTRSSDLIFNPMRYTDIIYRDRTIRPRTIRPRTIRTKWSPIVRLS